MDISISYSLACAIDRNLSTQKTAGCNRFALNSAAVLGYSLTAIIGVVEAFVRVFFDAICYMGAKDKTTFEWKSWKSLKTTATCATFISAIFSASDRKSFEQAFAGN